MNKLKYFFCSIVAVGFDGDSGFGAGARQRFDR